MPFLGNNYRAEADFGKSVIPCHCCFEADFQGTSRKPYYKDKLDIRLLSWGQKVQPTGAGILKSAIVSNISSSQLVYLTFCLVAPKQQHHHHHSTETTIIFIFSWDLWSSRHYHPFFKIFIFMEESWKTDEFFNFFILNSAPRRLITFRKFHGQK